MSYASSSADSCEMFPVGESHPPDSFALTHLFSLLPFHAKEYSVEFDSSLKLEARPLFFEIQYTHIHIYITVDIPI